MAVRPFGLVYILGRKLQQANQRAPAKVLIKFGLIINDMDISSRETKLYMEVWEIGWYASSQAL